MASKEELTELGKSIENSVQHSIQAGVQAVIIPPDTKKLIAEISQAFDSQDIRKIETALNKIEKITSRLGIDLASYNQSLAKTVEKYSKERSDAELKIEDLKKRNIIAETRVVEKDGKQIIQAVVLSKREIRQREKVLKKDFIRLEKDERHFRKEVERAKSATISTEKSEKIIEEEAQLTQRREDLTKQQERLTKTESASPKGEGFHEMPDFLRGPFEMAKEFLMTPITMAKEFTGAIGGAIKGVKQMTKFIFGNFFKALKMVWGAFKKLNITLLATIFMFIVKMAKWIIVGTALFLVIKTVTKAFKWLWQKLKDFVNWISDKISFNKDISKMTEEEKQAEIVKREKKIASDEKNQFYSDEQKEKLRMKDQDRIDRLKESLQDKKEEEIKDEIKETFTETDEEGNIKPMESFGKFFEKFFPMIQRQRDLERIKKEGPAFQEAAATNNAIINNAPTTNVTGSTLSVAKNPLNDDITFNRVAGQDA